MTRGCAVESSDIQAPVIRITATYTWPILRKETVETAYFSLRRGEPGFFLVPDLPPQRSLDFAFFALCCGGDFATTSAKPLSATRRNGKAVTISRASLCATAPLDPRFAMRGFVVSQRSFWPTFRSRTMRPFASYETTRLGARPRPGLQAGHKTRHDNYGQDLHRPLNGDGKKEITHHPADFGKVGIGPAQLDTNSQIGR